MHDLPKLKVLLVDDDDIIRTSMDLFFKNKSSAFKAVETAELGLEALEDNGPWDIVISDYQLPRMNGIDFLKIVRKKWPNVMRIMATSYFSAEFAAEAITAGIYDYIQKPFIPERVIDSLTNLIYKKKNSIYELSVDGRKTTNQKEINSRQFCNDSIN